MIAVSVARGSPEAAVSSKTSRNTSLLGGTAGLMMAMSLKATVTEPTGHVLPGTCGVNGQCAIDGLTYTCICNTGFTGDDCADIYVPPAHCHEVDCNNYGGYNMTAGFLPNTILQTELVPYCCQYDSRAEFDAVCNAETQAKAYANLGCCARTFCV